MTPEARRLLLAALAGFAATYAVLSINRSPLLPGVNGDSVEYLSAAQSFASNGTFEVPVANWTDSDSVSVLAHFPPGFPLLISLPLGGSTSAPAAALWVMAVSTGVAVMVVTLLVAETLGLAVGLLTVLLLMVAPVWARLDLAIWSEPSYLAVTAILLYAMVRRPTSAWLHGLLAAAGFAIRYVGVAGTLAVVVWAALQEGGRKQRIARVAWAAAPSAAFLLWWRHRVGSGGGTIRRLGFYGEPGRNVQQLALLLRQWLLPASENIGLWAVGLVAVAGVAVLVLAARRGIWRDVPRARLLLRAMVLFSGCYLAVVVGSRMFADPRIPFDDRMLAPVLVFVTVAFAASAVELARWGGHWGLIVLTVAVAAWSVPAFLQARGLVSLVNQRGMYFTFMGWTVDPVLRWVENESGAYDRIYTDDPALVYFQTGRHARALPLVGEDLEAFRGRFREAPAAVVILYPPQVGNLPDEDFVQLLGLRTVVRTRLGAVYVPDAS